ncbi:hypothetical protein F8388_010861 [Cannabis sativa]|uniref:Uncharacterized protein n=1 Tax=Cannabis sativa TaxID=3483 RepID=A0A7J6DYR8_CANSA|nr:hypothetical protein F8388_010861 [Cannabis sativa]KAF4370665.1 hypothetical protein G4B88_013421 [Cannabis sativa]
MASRTERELELSKFSGRLEVKQAISNLDTNLVPSALDSKDLILWHYNKNGEYTTKSGYQVAIKKKKKIEEGSNMDNVEQWWRSYQRLNTFFGVFVMDGCLCGVKEAGRRDVAGCCRCALHLESVDVPYGVVVELKYGDEDPIDFLSYIARILPNDRLWIGLLVTYMSFGIKIMGIDDCCSTGGVVEIIRGRSLQRKLLAIKHENKLAGLLSLERCKISFDYNMGVAMLGRPPDLCGEWTLFVSNIRRMIGEFGIVDVSFQPCSTDEVVHFIAKDVFIVKLLVFGMEMFF